MINPSQLLPLQVHQALTDDQKQALYRFRYGVFTGELGKYGDTADHARQELRDPLDEVASHLFISDGESIVGSMRQVQGRQHASEAMLRNYQLHRFSDFADQQISFTGRLMIDPGRRGSAALPHLLQAIYEHGRQNGVLVDFIFCDPHLITLYELLGYRRYGPAYFDPVLGFQMPLVLMADDLEHLEQLRSVFLPVARCWPSGSANAAWLKNAFPEIQYILSPASLGSDNYVHRLEALINTFETPCLRGLNDLQRRSVLAACTHIAVEPGISLMRHSRMREMYVVLSGEARVSRAKSAGTYEQSLVPGDCVGLEALLGGEAQETNFDAITKLQVILLDRDALQRLVKTQPTVAALLLMNLSQILAQSVSRRRAA